MGLFSAEIAKEGNQMFNNMFLMMQDMQGKVDMEKMNLADIAKIATKNIPGLCFQNTII